jgi:hypothetical protein
MNSPRLHILLPFALPPATLIVAAMQNLESPALQKLLAQASLRERSLGIDFQRTLPHERWLAREFDALDLAQASPGQDETPLAPYMLLADGGMPGSARWACIEPVHVQIARDHLVLIEPDALDIGESEAATLLDAARGLIEDLGVRLEAPATRRWYVSSPSLDGLTAAAPLRASGRNIEIWLPHDVASGERSRAWMKLQNEVQMAWFEHPVNQAREARGLPAINSIWLHAPGSLRDARSGFVRVLSAAPATRGLAMAAGLSPDRPVAQFADLAPIPGDTLLELDCLTRPFMQQDWYGWTQAYAQLEANWFKPALAALESGKLAELGLTLCADTGFVTLAVTRSDLRKFWRRRPFTALALD